MDRLAREDIAAAAAVHQELGRDYDDAVAESLVERIGAEIDKRVDARLAQRGEGPLRRPADGQVSPGTRASWSAIVLALGSMGIGIGAAGAVLSKDSGAGYVVVLIWIIIGVINVAYARRR
jgi:hypothetical protein